MEVSMSNSQNPRCCVVLGGQGFIGISLIFRILKQENWIIRIADYPKTIDLELANVGDSSLSDAISSGRVSYHHVDVRDSSLISKVINGSSIVFYFERNDLPHDDISLSHTIIVQGARNVINACKDCKVKQLIYNSTADVIFDGSHDLIGVDESFSCHGKVEDVLSELKGQAEALILSANNVNGLITCALRPSNVFGPRDSDLVIFWAHLAKYGLAKFIVGNGANISDFTYVENVSHAHICAAKALECRTISIGGKAFFVTNEEPIQFWEFISLILEGLNYQRPVIKIPKKVGECIFQIVKWMAIQLDFKKYNHFQLTRMFNLSKCTRTFNFAAAREHIGYSPIVTLEEGIQLTLKTLSHLARESHRHSKVHKLLGSGKVADILLWRDVKTTLCWLIITSFLVYWTLLSGRTFISSMAKLLQLFTIILYFHHILPIKMCIFTNKEQYIAGYQNSELITKDFITATTYLWNRGVLNAKLLAHGHTWNRFVKILVSIYFGKIALGKSMTMTLGIAVVGAFTIFFVYDQCELQVDVLAILISRRVRELLMMKKITRRVSSFSKG
ncbi:3beta-hydroxysteroid-dehydrogenase/decarboxylase isoform 3 [Linum grandiflorum]